MDIKEFKELLNTTPLKDQVEQLKAQIIALKAKLSDKSATSLIATKISDEILASTKSLYDYLFSQDTLFQSDGSSINDEDYHKYLYMALIIDALKDESYEKTSNELCAISTMFATRQFHNDTDITSYNHFVQLWKAKSSNNPFLKVLIPTLEDWKIFLFTLPPVIYHKKLNYQNYLNAQGPKIIQKLLSNNQYESKDIKSIKILLQELKNDKKTVKPNEKIYIYYSMPTYLKDIAFNQQDAFLSKQKIMKYLEPTFDNEGNLNEGHIKQQSIEDLIKQKKAE